MNALELLQQLRSSNIAVRLDGERLQVDAPKGALTDALREQLIAHKAEILELLRAAHASATDVAPIPVAPRDGALPLSPGQQRLWLLNEMEPGSAAYVMPFALRLRGEIDLQALQSAFGDVIRRHEALRTVIVATDGVPRQCINAPSPFALPVIDLADRGEAGALAAARDLAESNARESFDIGAGPLMRAQVLRLGSDDHVLLIAFHHIVFDAWSSGIFARELGACYSSRRAGGTPRLPEPPLHFADYAAWQHRMMADGGRERQLAYWTQQLSGVVEAAELPSDRARGNRTSSRGASARASTGAPVAAALEAFCRAQGVTPAMTLLAALEVLMHRLSGQSDVLIGTPVAGRRRAETEGVIGFFVNTVVMRTSFTSRQTFLELLQHVKRTALEAYEHEDMPFEDLVGVIEPQRSLTRTPIFQVMFNHIGMELPELSLPGVSVEVFSAPPLESKFDLTLYARGGENGIDLLASYDEYLFDSARIRELLEQYIALLSQAVAEPSRAIDEYDLVTAAARARLPDPSAPLDADQVGSGTLTLTDLARHGDKVALQGVSAAISYAELDRRATRLAQRLVLAGIERGEIVAVYAERDPALAVALLGILRAGGAFAVLDPGYPDEGLAARWRAAQPSALLFASEARPAEGALRSAIAGTALKIVVEVGEETRDGTAHAEISLPHLQPDDLAYVAFTSGTTGDVKAIAGSHGPVHHFTVWQGQTFDLRSDERFTLLSGLGHDPLLRDIFTPLSVGATLCVPRSDVWSEPEALAQWLVEVDPTVMHLTPALARMIAAGAPQGAALARLRYAFFGGDVLTSEVVGALRQWAPRAQCVNFYGATETPQAMGFHVVPAQGAAARHRLPIGRGIDGVQLLVVNRAERLAGIGELGEIVIRTPHLALGYRGDAELTAARFTANPLTSDPGDRVYRTGDLGRYLPDGTIDYVGRHDGQVKVRGFRVELGEVEAALREASDVAQAAVVLRRDNDSEPRLVAYVVTHVGRPLDAAALRNSLRRRLPEYAVPADYVALAALPLTPNGKLDRRALPAPDLSVSVADEPPRTPAEELVAGIFAAVLGRDRIGRNASFFDLGGHSLLAARAVARLRSQFGAPVALRTLFEAPTPAALAAQIESSGAVPAGEEAPPALERRPDGEAALSFSQQRLWFLDQLEPDSTAYVIAGAMSLEGQLHVGVLEAALNDIVRRHEVLRTVFTQRGGVPQQTVLDDFVIALPVEDLQALPAEERRGAALRRAAEVAQEPMDLNRGPLLRVRLLRERADSHVLVFAVHHTVFDGWSAGVFVRELDALYRAHLAGEPPKLAALPVQYADYAVWQRRWLQGAALERQLSFWRERLSGLPASLDLPTDRPRPAVVTYRGARWSCVFSPQLRSALAEVSRREGVTLFMTLLAGFKVLLARYTGQHDIFVGSPVANRSRPELEGLIGFFVNTLVLRSRLEPSLTFRELLAQMRETCLGAWAHQDLPFERLVEELKPPRDPSRNPLFQVMFALQNMDLPAIELPGLVLAPVEFERATSQVDLTLFMREDAQGLSVTFEYSTDLFDRSTIETLAEHFRNVLASAAAAPHLPLSRLDVLGDDGRAQLLRSFNGTGAKYPAEATVLDLFEAHVAAAPERPALRLQSERRSYGQVDAEATKLARRLEALGIGPGRIVGLCVQRGIDMVQAILAIWKTGAAYLPLDPHFPPDRLRYMLEDSGASLLLAQRALEIDAGAVRRLDIDAPPEEVSNEGAPPVSVPTDAARRAYVIYTSGSTGKPKGVEVPHGALTNFLLSMAREPGLTAGDLLAAVTTISFDISLLELFLPLVVGGEVLIVDSDTLGDGRRLRAALEESGATVMQATPSLWRILIAAGWTGRRDFKVLCGGEPFPPDLAEWLVEHCGQVWNMYGPTETTVWSTCERITDARAAISIGKPIANTQVYVLDEAGELLPPRVPGELYIGGDGVALGYLNRPALTSERFVQNRFAAAAGARMYRTGDQARWLADGRLQHLGRLDSQVKIRGFRIELGEIEAALREHPRVTEAAVHVWAAGSSDQRLAAYFVARGNHVVAADLRKHLRGVLPEYMIPQHFVELPSLPLTPNGKIDRKALPSPLHTAANTVDANPPRGATEELIAAVWREVVGDVEISRHANFFDVGGHSLLAIRAIALIEERTGWRPTPRLLILENLQEIASRCDKERPQAPAPTQRGLLARLKSLIAGAE